LLVIIFLWQTKLGSINYSQTAVTIVPTVVVTSKKLPLVTFLDRQYAYDLIRTDDISKLSLIINDNFESGNILSEKYSCREAINGGFYGTDMNPLGLLIADGDIKSKITKSSLLNGFLLVNTSAEATISYQPENNSPRIALQSGPMIFYQGEKLNLSIKNDKFSRRMVAFQTETGVLYFLTLINPESELSGPRLNDLPSILETISTLEGFVIENAINLDGGSASFFKSNRSVLKELNPIGSLFCIR